MKPRTFGPLSYYRSTDMDRTVTLMHHLKLSAGRFRLEFGFQTQASVDRIKRQDAYAALRKKAVEAWSPHTVEWTLEDHWHEGGTFVTATALLQRIVDGAIANPWPDEGDAG
ncbi:hypothetical protein [Sphingobium sp. CCH11-B1]|uniref:hypothetical protein n=1 Tax=Sphingobium sp. CCH11-B1 TaxID=1768781 RepID=UPI00082F3825|nr:hypothetical protein [Sphingobium sp. CCH11-B1]